MDMPAALNTRLPDFLRGACLAPLAPGALVPITAFAAAAACSVVLRSAFDLAQPIPVGDEREGGRLLLQMGFVIGLTTLLYFVLMRFAGTALLPAPDEFGPLLRWSFGYLGGAMALRALVRMQITLFRAPDHTTPSLVVETAGLPAEDMGAPQMLLERPEPDHRVVSKSNFPAFAIGVLLLAVALQGWKMNSLCLFRLPQ